MKPNYYNATGAVLPMKLYSITEHLHEVFRNHAADAKLVLLHPDSHYRSVLVAQLINTPDLNVFYYALGPDDINVHSFVSGLMHDVANQQPTFGRHINMLAPDEVENPEILLNTFARDLAELSSEPFYFVLDEYDRSDSADDIQMFIERLIDRLPEHCTIVINSRTLPRLPWVAMIAKNKAVMLRDDELVRRDFYGTDGHGTQLLEVYALGPGFVLLNDQPIDTWEGHLPRLLFFFALDRPVVTRSEICEAFWPELDTDQAVNVFHVTKRRLHKALDMDVLVHEEGYYRVNPELNVQYDTVQFVIRLMEGREQTNPNRVQSWQRAIEMYRGPFLQGHADPWIMARRKDFRAGYLEALMAMANVRLAEERPEHALGLIQRALTEDNRREDLHREIMRLYTRLGRRSEAAAHYQRFTDEMRKQGQEVASETRAVYEEIMS
jgi:DNA-binding SARP family transcriptional activator